MASKDMMDRFVMGVYLPTAIHTLITENHSGIRTELREGGVYPVLGSKAVLGDIVSEGEA
jgi:hypothetical protein